MVRHSRKPGHPQRRRLVSYRPPVRSITPRQPPGRSDSPPSRSTLFSLFHLLPFFCSIFSPFCLSFLRIRTLQKLLRSLPSLRDASSACNLLLLLFLLPPFIGRNLEARFLLLFRILPTAISPRSTASLPDSAPRCYCAFRLSFVAPLTLGYERGMETMENGGRFLCSSWQQQTVVALERKGDGQQTLERVKIFAGSDCSDRIFYLLGDYPLSRHG